MSSPAGGSYQLFIRLAAPVRIRVGALGLRDFPSGLYVYTGSAMRGLLPRIARHCRRAKAKRWHIDYLLAARGVRIERILIHPSGEREECRRNREVSLLPGAVATLPGFGSSDCRSGCRSHLFRLMKTP